MVRPVPDLPSRPPEIDLCGDKLAIPDGMHLAVTEGLTVVRVTLVDDESTVPILDLVDVVESGHRLAVGPADFEIGLTVERIIDRACKVIPVGDQRSMAARSLAT
jgi:hypothetical protein